MNHLRAIAKRLVPRPLSCWARRLLGWRWFRGDFATWGEAAAQASGYDSAVIVERVLAATLAVRDGRVAFERDGVAFPKAEPDGAFLEALQQASAGASGPLRVLDFGGALGSLYWRHRPWLHWGPGWCWDVVEQPAFVAAGRQHLAGSGLRFCSSVEEAEELGRHDLFLCSTTLQYLEDPHAALTEWRKRGWRYLLFNNLPLHRDGPDRLRVQHVPPSIYPASYPVWFFNRERLLADLASDYGLVVEFPSEAVWPVGWGDFPSTGLLFERRST